LKDDMAVEGMREEWPPADPRAMAIQISAGLAYLGCGGYAVRRYRPRLFPLWLFALFIWGTLCKYLICARCERYGQACDFCYGGKYAAFFFKRRPDRTLDAAGIAAEGISGMIMQFLPVLAAVRNRRLLVLYVFINLIWQAVLLQTACKKCVLYSKDPWKEKYCPSYRMAKIIFGA
jgi:hypothetical protein